MLIYSQFAQTVCEPGCQRVARCRSDGGVAAARCRKAVRPRDPVSARFLTESAPRFCSLEHLELEPLAVDSCLLSTLLLGSHSAENMPSTTLVRASSLNKRIIKVRSRMSR